MDDSSRARPWLVALLLFGAALALYAPSTNFPFVEYDDGEYVRANPHLADGLSLECLRWALTSTTYQYNWHPLTWLSHGLDVQLFGFDAGRHHLVNAFLHALNAALLFVALRALSGRLGPSACAAALFALHPLRVESVAWIAQRKDLLAGTFFLLTLIAHARQVRAPSPGGRVRVVLALAAGLACKPTLVTLPCLLLVLDAWPLGRLRAATAASAAALVLEKLPLFALSLASALVTLTAQHAGGAVRDSVPLATRLVNAALAYWTYLGQFFWPRGLAVFYPHPALTDPARSRLGAGLVAALLLALALTAAVRLRRRRPWVLVGSLWFLGLLVPMIGLVQVGNQAHADRYGYLALIGIELAVVWSAAALLEARPRLRLPLGALGLAWLAGLGFLTSRQLRHWRSSEALFEHAIQVTERNFVAHNNLGLVLGNAGRMDEALAHFEAATEARPGFFEAELNTGKARHRRGEREAARAAFERAVQANPASGEAHLCLAVALAGTGERTRAEEELGRALATEPGLAQDPRVRALRQGLEPGRN